VYSVFLIVVNTYLVVGIQSDTVSYSVASLASSSTAVITSVTANSILVVAASHFAAAAHDSMTTKYHTLFF
jgi:hypothetical protein